MKNNQENKDLKKQIRKKSIKKGLNIFWYSFIFSGIFLFLILLATYKGLLGEMPEVEDLDNPDIYVASEIISADGIVIDKFEAEKRIPVEYKDLPNHLVDALLAKEDERFYEHSGIDAKAVIRAIYYLGNRGGGSTISQQLAKLLFTDIRSKNVFQRAFQKVKEWIIAVQLEKRYTKQEIITMYFNKFDYLHNALGVEMASKVYFSKNTKDLTLDEAAIFVGMFENPVKNNPKGNPENSRRRRDVVLGMMKDQGRISQTEYDNSIQKPIKLNYQKVEDANKGFSSYYKAELRKEVQKYLTDYEKESGKKHNLYKDGLKIYVTLDSRMQAYAEQAIKEHMKDLQRRFFSRVRGMKNAPFFNINTKKANDIMFSAIKRTERYKNLKRKEFSDEQIIEEFKKPTELEIFTWKGYKDTILSPWDSIRYHKHIANTGLMAMEPITGNIKAWVGGIDWNYFKYDHVKQARRQVGSTFKPFVYASLIVNNGYTPCSTISNATFTRGNWTPKGANGAIMSIKDALSYSKNPATVRAMDITGINNTIALARDLGVESPITENLTSALGSSDITLYEMLGAYSTFANYGTYTKPEMIWRIEDANGKVIKEYMPEQREVLNELHAYAMIEIMKGVIEKGTGKGIRKYGITADVAGKTGTTDDNSDGWFIGITPKLSCGVWVGWEDRAAHFPSTAEGQGAMMALPIWGLFMKKVYANSKLGYSQKDKFIPPNNQENFECSQLKEIGGYNGNLESIYDDYDDNRNYSGYKNSSANINARINKKDSIDFNNDN